MSELMQNAVALWQEQLLSWPLAATYYGSLQKVKTREFEFDHTRVLVQFNPARATSTTAKTDAAAIAQRPCFLCVCNRPIEQRSVDAGDYYVLVNPFPIFRQHFTIPHKQHLPQQILPYFADFLFFARELPDFVVFYNGPRCGASAPDHLHFQAGNKGVLPLIDEYLSNPHQAVVIENSGDARLLQCTGVLRQVLVIESNSIHSMVELFSKVYHSLPADQDNEPMMNVAGLYENGKWITFVLPRVAFRPWQFNASEPDHLMISPAAIEMTGILITPVEDHFQKITPEDIESIYHQISPDLPWKSL